MSLIETVAGLKELEAEATCTPWRLHQMLKRDWQARADLEDFDCPGVNLPTSLRKIMGDLDDALDEIERLRAENEDLKRGLEDAVRNIRQQCGTIASLRAQTGMTWQITEELENALAEERARGNHYGMSYEEAVSPDPIERWIINGEIDAPKIYIDRVRDEARRQLQAEGKIGTGDHIVETNQMVPNGKCWPITEERITAIKTLLIEMDAVPTSVQGVDLVNHAEEVLKAMLEEA